MRNDNGKRSTIWATTSYSYSKILAAVNYPEGSSDKGLSTHDLCRSDVGIRDSVRQNMVLLLSIQQVFHQHLQMAIRTIGARCSLRDEVDLLDGGG